MTHNKLTCLFGHHDYGDKLTKDKSGHEIYLCKICQRSGHGMTYDGLEYWCNYDEEGNCIYSKWSNGEEVYRDCDDEGHCVHSKWEDGAEYWYNSGGDLTHSKWSSGRETFFKKGRVIQC